jgi:hypothetical protein
MRPFFQESVDNLAFVRAPAADGDPRQMWARLAGVVWMVGLVVVLLVGVWTQSGDATIAGLIVLLAITWVLARRGGFLKRR